MVFLNSAVNDLYPIPGMSLRQMRTGHTLAHSMLLMRGVSSHFPSTTEERVYAKYIKVSGDTVVIMEPLLMGPPNKGQPSYNGHLLRGTNNTVCSGFSFWTNENPSIKDKVATPKMPFVWRFRWSCGDGLLSVPYESVWLPHLKACLIVRLQ